MSSMCWAMLVFLLSTAGTLDAVDQAWLTRVVGIIRMEYSFRKQVCIAANIPQGVKPDDLRTDLRQNDGYQGNAEDALNRGGVYTGQRVVAASYAEGIHAETRVLNAMRYWNPNSQGNFLIFYTYLSPCATRCANEADKRNILKTLSDTLKPWDDRKVLVFGRPYTRLRKTDISREQITESLQNLAKTGFGQNIFRCYKPPKAKFQCCRCFSDQNMETVAHQCVVDSEGNGGQSQGPSSIRGQEWGSRNNSGSRSRGRSGNGSTSRGHSGNGSRSRGRSGNGSRSHGHSGNGSRGHGRGGSGSRSRGRSGSDSRSRRRSGSSSRNRRRSRSQSPKRRFEAI